MSDLISRQDAIDAIYKESKYANSEVADEYADMFVYALKTLPSAQKTGKWETVYLDHVSIGCRPKVLYCSKCHQCIAYPTNYCPHCGARMVGEKE